MFPSDHTSSSSTWVLRTILWVVAIFIVLSLVYKIAFRKSVEQRINCLDRASAAQRATSPLTAVDGYARCIGKGGGNTSGTDTPVVTAGAASGSSDTRPARCRYTGAWAATRHHVTYIVALEATGGFTAEPGENAPAHPRTITGAWSVAGNALAWVYDSGPVWPPDINPISNESADAFTLSEVNGSTTRYTLIERYQPAICAG